MKKDIINYIENSPFLSAFIAIVCALIIYRIVTVLTKYNECKKLREIQDLNLTATITNNLSEEQIEDILEDARNGKMYILVDDPGRENEGDLIMPAQKITPEAINFMTKFGRGLVCLSLSKKRINELNLPLMNPSNQKNDLTAFTVSIEAKEGITTGISASDRAHTIAVAINESKGRLDILSLGHIFPLMGWDGGVLERAGHTEASIDISKLAGLNPSGVICEIMSENGSMARLPELIQFAKLYNLKIGTVSDLIKFRLKNNKIIKLLSSRSFESEMGNDFNLKIFQNQLSGEKHYALVKGIKKNQPAYVRMHKLDITKDIFEEKNIFNDEISKSFKIIEKRFWSNCFN